MRGGKYGSGGSASDMIYDDSSFQLFAVAFLAVYWLPVAFFRLCRLVYTLVHRKTPMELAMDAWCTCSLCQKKADKHHAAKRGIKGLTGGDVVFFAVTLLLAYATFNVYRANLSAEPQFDPFAILGVKEDATPKELKKVFRQLAVVHHPDKNRDDPLAAERFVQISKAYEALTDEVSKENYVRYGNPDGHMGTTWGLGLPALVGENRNVVLLIYGAFMVFIFPAVVGMWWFRHKQQLTSEIMTSTFMLYRETMQVTTRFRDLLAAFCGSDEFNELYTSDNEQALKELNDSLRKAGVKDMQKTKSVVEPSLSQIQNLVIMTAYLARVPVPEKLRPVLRNILQRAEPLLTSMTDTVGVFQRSDCKAAWEPMMMQGHTLYLARCLHLTQSVYQALDEKASPLLQIPHFTEREVKYCSGGRSGSKSIYDLMRMSIEDLQRVLRDFSPDQILDVKAYCDRYPSACLEVSAPRVEDVEDDRVHEGDVVTMRVTMRILRRSGSAFSPHAPHLPYRKEEVWWLWLADEKRACPIEVRRLLPKMARGHDGKQKSGFDMDVESDEIGGGGENEEARLRQVKRDEEVQRLAADPRVTVFEVMFRFMAPKAGLYSLEVRTACDCYAGASKTHSFTMRVAEAAKVPEVEVVADSELDSEEESEEEESEEEAAENGGDDDGDGAGDGDNDETDGEYEYIEVTASESEDGELSDDEFGVSGAPKGDPTA